MSHGVKAIEEPSRLIANSALTGPPQASDWRELAATTNDFAGRVRSVAFESPSTIWPPSNLYSPAGTARPFFALARLNENCLSLLTTTAASSLALLSNWLQRA